MKDICCISIAGGRRLSFAGQDGADVAEHIFLLFTEHLGECPGTFWKRAALILSRCGDSGRSRTGHTVRNANGEQVNGEERFAKPKQRWTCRRRALDRDSFIHSHKVILIIPPHPFSSSWVITGDLRGWVPPVCVQSLLLCLVGQRRRRYIIPPYMCVTVRAASVADAVKELRFTLCTRCFTKF